MRCVTLMLVAALGLPGCSDNTPKKSPPTAETAAVPTSVFAADRPAQAPNLLEAKADTAVGDKVVFLARVGGQVKSFLDGQSVFIVADPSLISCELMGEKDHCDVPWDYCCEDFEDLRAGLATIRILGADGKPVKSSAMNAGGLDHSKFVVVTGVVNQLNDEGMFVVDAHEIWVGGKPNRGDLMAGSK